MDDTDPASEAANTAPPAAASTSSTRTDESPHADPLIALGERILAELGDPHTNNTLIRWLAHHTARLIRAADDARAADAPDADARAADARAAILQLWQARGAWPAGWPPHRAAEVARLLEDLPSLDDDNGWYRQTVLSHLQDLHYHVLAVLVDRVTEDGNADVEQRWLDRFGDRLTPHEVLLLRRAVSRPRRIEPLLRWSDRMAADQVKEIADEHTAGDDMVPTSPAHPLQQLADAYRATITNLIQRATATKPSDAQARTEEPGADNPA